MQKAKAKLTPFPAFVHLMPGQIVSNLKTLSGPFDLIFVDMDKKDYALVYQEILRLLVHGGTVLIDNLFFGGRIWEEGPAKSNSVGAIWQLLHSLEQNAQFSLSVLPVGDGLGIAQRLKK